MSFPLKCDCNVPLWPNTNPKLGCLLTGRLLYMTPRQQIHKGWRIFLKYTLNPFTRRLARTSFGPFSLIRHVGRRSGKQYETPLIVARIDDGFVIELTYGPDVDWYKNIQAAGGCTIHWHGKDYVIDKIEPMDVASSRAAFPFLARVLLRLTNRQHFLKMATTQVGAGG